MYFAVKSLLVNTQASVQLGMNLSTPWFQILSGVRQGDTLSPTLFSLFINDLVTHLKENCPTLHVNDMSLNALLYAGDMVLFAENEENLQLILNEMNNWFRKW